MKPLWKSSFTLEELQARSKKFLAEHLGIVFKEIGPNYLVAEMEIKPHHLQPEGILHGGASAVLAETVGSVAASCALNRGTHSCVGLELNINHIKATSSGVLRAKAFPYHIGRMTQVWSIEIRNQDGVLIAISRLTVANLETGEQLSKPRL